jgi:hypothetical protein
MSLSIETIIQQQLAQIRNPLIKGALEKLTVVPRSHLRKWDYGTNGEEFECWTIAVDNATDTSIIYSEFGFGPKYPWGLVFSSKLNFGMDSGWFNNLEDCFLNSWAASGIPIWFIERRIDSNEIEIIAENLTSNEADLIISNRTKQNKEYYVRARK